MPPSTKVSDTIFDVINKVPDQAKAETGNPARPSKATDEEWAKIQKDSQELAKDSHDYAVWAFFQVLPRVTDPAKQIQVLDAFLKAYPDVEKDDATQVNTIYFQAYQRQGNLDKTVEYGDKVIATDPNNVAALNTMGLIYAFYLPHPSTEKAAVYAQKALAAAQGLKKPEGVDDAAFKKEQDTQVGMANLTLGYAALMKAAEDHEVGADRLRTEGRRRTPGRQSGAPGSSPLLLGLCLRKAVPRQSSGGHGSPRTRP